MKKVFKIIYYVVLIFLAIIALMLIVSVLPIGNNIKFMTVLSGSMAPTIKTGSVVMTKPMTEYKVGDIITFGPYTKTKAPTTHRIVEVKGDPSTGSGQASSGQAIYITKGDANNAPDAREIQKKDIIGKVIFDVPYLGYVIAFVRKPWGFMIILVLPALIIIIDEIKKIIIEAKKIKEIKKLKN